MLIFLNLFFFFIVLGPCCCVGFSLVVVSGVYSLVVVRWPLIVVVSLVVEQRLNRCGTQNQLLWRHMGSSPTRGRTCGPRWILYH